MKTSSLIESVSDRFADAVSASHTYRGDETVVLRQKFLLEVAGFLKEDPALEMNLLVDLSAVDYSSFDKHPAPAFFASSKASVSSEFVADFDRVLQAMLDDGTFAAIVNRYVCGNGDFWLAEVQMGSGACPLAIR